MKLWRISNTFHIYAKCHAKCFSQQQLRLCKHAAAKPEFIPENPSNDWIGPPHPLSNLRPSYIHIPKDETPTETQFRLQREAVQKWNQEFWELHNERFYKDKNEYIAKYFKTPAENTKEPPPEEMAKFYKQFLDENHNQCIRYNWEWYQRNIGLLWPAIKVFAIRLYKRRKT